MSEPCRLYPVLPGQSHRKLLLHDTPDKRLYYPDWLRTVHMPGCASVHRQMYGHTLPALSMPHKKSQEASLMAGHNAHNLPPKVH